MWSLVVILGLSGASAHAEEAPNKRLLITVQPNLIALPPNAPEAPVEYVRIRNTELREYTHELGGLTIEQVYKTQTMSDGTTQQTEVPDTYVIEFPAGIDVQAALAKYQAMGAVVSVEEH